MQAVQENSLGSEINGFEITLDFKNPLSIADVSKFLNSIQDGYNIHKAKARDADNAGIEIKLSKVKEGSFVWEFVFLAPGVLPLFDYTKAAEWFKNIGDIISKVVQKDKEISLSTGEANIIESLTQMVIKDGNRESKVVARAFNFGSGPQLVFAIGNGDTETIKTALEEYRKTFAAPTNQMVIEAAVVENVSSAILRYTKISDGPSSKKGDTGLISQISNKVGSVYYFNQEIRKEMIHIEENPLHMEYNVDIEVTKKGDSYEFRIMKLNKIFEVGPLPS